MSPIEEEVERVLFHHAPWGNQSWASFHIVLLLVDKEIVRVEFKPLPLISQSCVCKRHGCLGVLLEDIR